MRIVARYLHTMYRITDPERSRRFCEALGFESRRQLPIVRKGELEATNYFFGMPGQEEELELTFNHDGAGTSSAGYGHIAIGVDDLDETLARLKEQGIEPEREAYRVREGGSRLCFVRDPDRCFRTSNSCPSAQRTAALRLLGLVERIWQSVDLSR
jgi:lactoylglutathione lyase